LKTSGDSQSWMQPFHDGDQSNTKFYFTLDEMYRQQQNGALSHSYSCWSVRPIVYEEAVYGQVICLNLDGVDIDPVKFKEEDSETMQIPEEAGIKLIIYMKFGDIDVYTGFFRKVRSTTTRASSQLIRDYTEQILDIHWFDTNNDLIIGRREKALKLTKSQWHNKVASR